jgi:hypothetical protein
VFARKGARTVADDPVAETTAEDAPKKPKYKRPPIVGDKRRLKGENVELEMISQLGDQARGILKAALTADPVSAAAPHA